MRVLYDGFIYSLQVAGGINRYFANLIPRIAEEITPVVVGRLFEPEEGRPIAELELERKILHLGLCSDSDLARLYEGFGIPIVGAMPCGAPVIASDNSSIPEVLADAGLRFNPKPLDELVDRMRQLLEHPVLLARLIERGDRAKAGPRFEHRHHLPVKQPGQWIRATAGTRRPRLRREPRILLNSVGCGGAERGLAGGHARGVG